MLRKLFKNTFLRYMLSYVLLMAVLVGGIAAYMYSYYRKSVYDSAKSNELAATIQMRQLADGYLTALRICADEGAQADILEGGKMTLTDSAAEPGAFISTLRKADSDEDSLLFGYGGSSGTALLDMEKEAFFSLNDEYGDICNRYIVFDNDIACQNGTLKVDESRLFSVSASEIRRIGGRDYLFVSEESRFDGIRFLSVLSLNDIHLKAAGVWLGFAAVLLVFALPVILLIYIISKRNLTSIANLRGRFDADTEGKDDISAINEGIDALEGRARDMAASSLKARRQMFVRRLVSGSFESKEELLVSASEVELSVNYPFCAVLLTGMGRGGEDGINLEGMLRESENLSVMGMELVESEQMLLIAFADEAARLYDYAKELCALPAIKRLRLPVAMSAVHEDASALPTAYLEATSAYDSRFVMGDQRLLSFSDISFAGASDDAKKSGDFAMKLKNALSEGDRERTEKEIGELTAFLKSADLSLFGFRKFYNDIISVILSSAGDAGMDKTEIYSLFSLSGCRSADELDGILRRVCESVISSQSAGSRVPMVQEVMRLMSEKYTDSAFTISEAADKLGVTTVRLSQEFKADTGVTPNDYLTRLRMEEAKRLLKQTDLPIRDVSALSGYSDASSFTRRFRLYEGVTPLQYRQNLRAGS